MRRVMYVAGLPVGLEAADGGVPAVELLFKACPHADETALVEIEVTDDAPTRPGRPPDVPDPEHVDLWFEPDGLVVFERLGLGAVASGTTIRAGGPDGDGRSWRLVVQYALVDALARLGRHAVHAAAFARDGVAVLALGGAGAGKSTLAYAAWRNGWDVLTDDIVWLHTAGAGVAAAGFPKPLAAPVELMGGRPPAGAVAIAGDARGRWILPIDAVTAGPPVPLVGVVQVTHSGGDAELAHAPSGPALLAAVMRSHPLVPAGRVARGFFPVAAATSRLPTVELRHDAAASRRAERAGALLDEALVLFRAGVDESAGTTP